MKRIVRFLIIVLLSVSFLAQSCSTSKINKSAQQQTYTPVSMELYNEITQMDSILFEAFNNRDLDKIKTLFTEDLEFYHDKGGLMDYQKNIEASKNLFANNTTLKRTLIKSSLEVYPIKDFGAVQTGIHRFCHWENRKEDCGSFKFVHIWQKKEGKWKLARVISYAH